MIKINLIFLVIDFFVVLKFNVNILKIKVRNSIFVGKFTVVIFEIW